MAKIEFSSRANSPAENVLTPIILLLGIVFAVFGIKLKWFRHRLTFNSSQSSTPISTSENTNQIFGVYKRQEIDERDFRAQVPDASPSTYTATDNHQSEGSSSGYKAIKVNNNEIRMIPPAYTPPTIHQGNIKTTELRVDFNNNNRAHKNSPIKDKKVPKYIRVKKDETSKSVAAPSKKLPAPQTSMPIHVTHPPSNTSKAAAPVLVPPPPVVIVPPPPISEPPSLPVRKKNKIAVSVVNPLPAPQIEQPKISTPIPVPEKLPYVSQPVVEVENPALTAKLNSMPTTYIQLNDFDSNETDDAPPLEIRSVKFHDEYESTDEAYNVFSYDSQRKTPSLSTNNSNMPYDDKIEIVTATNNDDLFLKMTPTPRTTGINYLEYQSKHNNNHNNETDDNSESKFNDGDDYELAPLEFLSKPTPTTTTNATAKNTATVNNLMTQNHTKATTTPTTTITTKSSNTNNNKSKDEAPKLFVDDSEDDDNDDADNDNMWDLVAKHRKNVGRKIEWRDQSVNVNSKMKHNQRAMMNSIVATDKPKTLRELHSQSRENNKKVAKPMVVAPPLPQTQPPTSKSSSNAIIFGELDDEADA